MWPKICFERSQTVWPLTFGYQNKIERFAPNLKTFPQGTLEISCSQNGTDRRTTQKNRMPLAMAVRDGRQKNSPENQIIKT